MLRATLLGEVPMFVSRAPLRSFLAAGALIALSAAGCNNTPPPAPLSTFRAVFITDTHIIGPQYTCCHENSAADNSSIVKTIDRLKALRDTINAIQPPPAMVLVAGDIVHAAHTSRDPAYYQANETAYSIARDLFKTFNMPVYLAMGNHDYEVNCASSDSFDRSFSEARFHELLATPPFQAVDYRGWKFLLTNSQRGPTFDVNDMRCRTEDASVGDEQMQWAAAQLDEGKPTVIVSHFMRLLYSEVESGQYKSFPKLLDAHTNVQAWFAGHSHRWVDLTGFNNDVPHWVLGGSRYDSNNFWLVEMEEGSSKLTILDQGKEIMGNSCAAAYSYDGTPMPIPNAVDTGDCVSGF
jgi:predicted MPP superfamily phosphohydrolase